MEFLLGKFAVKFVYYTENNYKYTIGILYGIYIIYNTWYIIRKIFRSYIGKFSKKSWNFSIKLLDKQGKLCYNTTRKQRKIKPKQHKQHPPQAEQTTQRRKIL